MEASGFGVIFALGLEFRIWGKGKVVRFRVRGLGVQDLVSRFWILSCTEPFEASDTRYLRGPDIGST